MIKDIQELNFPKLEGQEKSYATMSAATVSLSDMGEWTITSQIKIDGQIAPDFSFDWEVLHDGHKYIQPLREPQGSKEYEKWDSVIDLTFQHWAIYQLKRFPFVTMQPIDSGTAVADEEVATVSLNLGDFCKLFAQVLNYYYGDKITIQLNPDWQYKAEAEVITISHAKVWNVLIDTFQPKYGVRWKIEPNGSYDKYVIKVGYPTTEQSHIFEYGFEGGLMKVERQVQSEEICNILKGRGGEKNLPYRYFKNVDPNNDTFPSDPDWIEELKNIYFSNLMPATFRSYVQGWKAAHISKYPGYTAVGEANAYAPWAYRKGFTDTKFHPVEFVADEITIIPEDDDRQVEILPGYAPFVKKGSSLDKYGPLFNSLDNDEDTYPTIQGVNSADHPNFFQGDLVNIGRVDQVVAVEQVTSDDVIASVEADSRLYNLQGGALWNSYVPAYTTADFTVVRKVPFTVEHGRVVNLEAKNITLQGVIDYLNGKMEDFTPFVAQEEVKFTVYTDEATKDTEAIPAVGIPAGNYFYDLTVKVRNDYSEALSIGVFVSGVEAVSSTSAQDKWSNTFDIYIKNLWATSPEDGESDTAYAERVWKPILGDHLGSEAKVVFTSGMLATSEDYAFVITAIPKFERKEFECEVVEDGKVKKIRYTSEWKLTLAKSDADVETLGLYVPSKQKQGAAGDYFIFTGIDLPHPYVIWSEESVDNSKKDILKEKRFIKPTWVVQTDRVRLNNEGRSDALIRLLHPGDTLRLADKRFISGDYETLYISSLTITYREPTRDDAALNPDVEIVLSDRYEVSANPVGTLQDEVSALTRQVGSLSNVEQIVRDVGDKLYLRKDGISDRSMSPTEFASLLTSLGFRQGVVGGKGWGIFRDASGAWVIETDKINVRQDLQVNNLVVNQVLARGGMIVESAANMEVTRVIQNEAGEYVCYFDQKNGSVVNLFHLHDVAFCLRYSPNYESVTHYYRREVIGIGDNYIVLTGDPEPPEGAIPAIPTPPMEGDVIIQWGNTQDETRQYVIVRDVVNGGYERFIEGLDSVNAEGVEYFFIGREAGMYGDRPRFYVGDKNGYIEFVDGKLIVKARLSIESTIGDKTITEYIAETAGASSPAIIDLTNEIQGVVCDASGNVIAGLPALTSVTVYQNGQPQGDWQISIVPKGCVASISADHIITVSGILNNAASVEVTASKSGYADLHATFSLYKVVPGADGESPVLYEIGVSANAVSKDADGVFTPNLIKVTKYKTDALGRRTTLDNWLRYSWEGTTYQNILASEDGDSATVDIGPINTAATALILTLYDGDSLTSTVLDSERIPIIKDASGLSLGGVNILRNTNQGTRMWSLFYPSGVGDFVAVRSIDNKGVRFINDATTTNTQWQLAAYTLDTSSMALGSRYIFSFKSKTSSNKGVKLGVQIRHVSQAKWLTGLTWINNLPTDATRFEVPLEVTFAPQSGVEYRLCFYIESAEVWDEIEVWDLMLESGNVATAYSPSPDDIDYLKAALAESAVSDGGLMLTTLIKVGTDTDPETLEQKTTAGLSGIVDASPNARGGIAVWTGGEMSDLGNPDRDESLTPATSVLRHDGSAYFANNTIRFGQNIIEVGESVELNKDGLVMIGDDATQKLKVANVSVGDEIDIDAANIALSVTAGEIQALLQKKSKQVSILTPGGNGQPGTIDTETYYWWSICGANGAYTYNIPATLTKGASVDIRSCSVEIDTAIYGQEAIPLEGRARIRFGYYKKAERVYISTGIDYVTFKKKTGTVTVYIAEIKNMHIPASAISGGNYFVEVSLVTELRDLSLENAQKTAAVSLTGTAYNTFESTTILGNDGFLSIWGKIGLLVNGDKIVMRAGSYVLRLSEAGGIQKSTSGGSPGSWVNL